MHIRLSSMLTGWSIEGEFYHSYGWYHLLWIGICILLTVFVVKRYAMRHDPKTDDRVLLVLGAILLVSEVYKQIFILKDNRWQYAWYVLPWQFCDVPVYVMLLISLFKPGRFKDAMYSYIGYYGLLAGIAAMAWPEDLFTTSVITLLIQTMLWHSLLVVAGIYVVVAKGYGRHFFREVLPGFLLFLSFTGISVLLNETLGRSLPGFNLFYLSSVSGSGLPVLIDIYRPGDGALRWFLLIAGYITAFVLGVALEFALFKLTRFIKERSSVRHSGPTFQ